MTPICACCAAAPEHTITDERGKRWRFEQTRMFGPILLRSDGEPAARQPGPRSPFWAAYQRWQDQQQRPPIMRGLAG